MQPYPTCRPYMRFLSVRPDFCRRLPSDSTSRWTPLPLAISFPSLGRIRDFHPLEHAHAGRTQEKSAIEALLLRFCCGATGNRTRDTRIFSPLLYQLSYGTFLRSQTLFLSFGIAKVDIFSLPPNFFCTFCEKTAFFMRKSGFFVSSQML